MKRKRHTREQTRMSLKRYARRGREDACLAGAIDHEDLQAREFLLDEPRRTIYVRKDGVYLPFKGTPLDYALSYRGFIGKPIFAYFAERAKRDWRWANRGALARDRRANRSARTRADHQLFCDPEGNDPYIPVKNWLN